MHERTDPGPDENRLHNSYYIYEPKSIKRYTAKPTPQEGFEPSGSGNWWYWGK